MSNTPDYDILKLDKATQNFINTHWRPLMAWLYMATCAFDFIVAPVLWPILLASTGKPVTPWAPITLQGAGLYHLSMGGILGITSWQKTQERVGLMNLQSTAIQAQTTALQYNYSDPNIAARKQAAAANATPTASNGMPDADALIGKVAPK